MTPEQFEQVEAVFAAASELPPGDQRAYVEAHCADDPVVRREIESMLAEDARHHESLVGPTLLDGGIAALFDGDHTVELPPPLPERIGRYRVVGLIGHGGMGTVYAAEQQSPQRRVALKVIRREAMSRQLLQRFRFEAETLGRLQHPGIAQIFEAGTFDAGEGGQPFFAMEFIDGQPLQEFVQDRELDTETRLALFARICDAVHYAHQRGVIHRDLKPENVLVVDAGGGQPKILDFGIARATDSDVQMTTLQTDVGQLIGTVQYMSPEQALGDSRELDTRSDIYALGVMLFELLAERPPYDLSRRTIPESVLVIREEEPSRLSSVDVSFRGDVETIVGKCLEKEPDRRYQSASDLAEDIRRYLRDEPISARPPSTWYQLRKFARRNRTLVTGATATVLALVVGLVGTIMFALRAQENAVASTRNEDAALRQAYRASLIAADTLAATDPATAKVHLHRAPVALRGWEWQHIAARLAPQAMAYEGPAAPVGRAAISSDGALIAAGLENETVVVWGATRGVIVRTLPVGSPVTAVALPAAGPPILAVATGDGRVLAWDLATGGGPRTLARADEPVTAIAWARRSDRIALTTAHSVAVWENDRPVMMVPLFGQHFQGGVDFSPDGARVVTCFKGSEVSSVYVWDANTGERLFKKILLDAAQTHAFSPDGTCIAVGLLQRDVVLLDARTFEVTERYTGHRAPVARVTWSSDGRVLASAAMDGEVRLWDVEADTLAGIVDTGAEPATLAFDPHDASLVYNGERGLYRWDGKSAAKTTLLGHTTYVYLVSYSRDGTMLASGSPFDDRPRLWDPITGRLLAAFPAQYTKGITFQKDDRVLSSHGVRYRLATGRVLADDERGEPSDLSCEPGYRPTPMLAVSPDGRLRAALRVDGGSELTVTHLPEGDPAVTFDGLYCGVAFSPDGALLAGAGAHGTVTIWRTDGFEEIATLRAHRDEVYCVEFHPDGRRLASAGNDKTIRLWDTATWTEVFVLRGHESYVKALAFSPDGTQLASASGDTTVRVWDTVPRAARVAQAVAAGEHRARLAPVIKRALRNADGEMARAADAIEADPALGDADRKAAQRVLLERWSDGG